MLRLSLLAAGAAALQLRTESEANPMRRVITILQDMQKELQEEAHKEEDLYNNYECYCTKNTEGMSAEAVAAKQKIEELTARGEAEKAEKTQLDQDLVQHKADRVQATKELETATAVRNKERQAFEEENAEFLGNLNAIDNAVSALERGMGMTFLQGNQRLQAQLMAIAATGATSALDRHQQKVLASFVQGKSPYGAYQTSSSEVVGILKQMKERMDQDLGGVVSREEAAAAAFKELKAAKLQQIQAQTDAIESKQVRSGELAVAYVVTQNELKDTRDSLSATERFMADLSIACDAKKSDYEERLKTRADEIRAISEAIEVLNNDDALDIFKGTLSKPSSTALLQKSSSPKVAKAHRAQGLIQHLSKTSSGHKQQLGLIASLLKSGKVDFSKVIAMIDEMVEVLHREQDDDNLHRDWCHEEFDKNDDSIKASARKMHSLTAFIEESEERVQSLAEEIANAEEEVKNTDKAVAEATEQRKKEHEEYLQSQTELTAAQQLIGKAINRLNRFYNPALYKEPEKRQLTEEERIAKNLGQDIDETSQKKIAGTDITVEYMQKAASFLQQAVKDSSSAPPPPPETWDAYKKKDPQNRGVVYILGRLMQDLKSDQEEGQHEEKTAQADYEKLMSSSRDTRDSLTARITTNEQAKADLQEKVGDAKTSRQVEVNASMDLQKYKSELHGSCDFLINNFMMRKEARATEIDGLNQAKAVLSGATFQEAA